MLLGYPLCGCTVHTVRAGTPDWAGICLEFCRTQGMSLTGCASCEELEALNNQTNAQLETSPPLARSQQRTYSSQRGAVFFSKAVAAASNNLNDKTIHFNDADIGGTDPGDWEEWCNLVCKTGDGGAACNCDLAPLY